MVRQDGRLVEKYSQEENSTMYTFMTTVTLFLKGIRGKRLAFLLLCLILLCVTLVLIQLNQVHHLHGFLAGTQSNPWGGGDQ